MVLQHDASPDAAANATPVIPQSSPPSTPPSCTVCHDFQPLQSNPKVSWIDKWFNRYDIRIESLKDDCHRCILLRAIYERLLFFLVADYEGFDPTNWGQGDNKGIWLTPELDGTVVARYHWIETTEDGKEKHDSMFFRGINIRPADQSGEDGHDRCIRKEKTPLPTRVVRIDPRDDSLRLHEPQPDETGAYIALSHCWGSPDRRPIRTTKDTVSQMEESIPSSSLSAVFQDAVWLCQQLEVYDIWIDSLCIIQDDGLDWEIESARMAQYYSNAELTISAESSPDGTVPFLKEIHERWQPMVYSGLDESDCPCSYVVQEHHWDHAVEDHSSIYQKDGYQLLPTRAWTMQEWILSSRIVHFTPSDLIWGCNAVTKSYDTFRNLQSQGDLREAFYLFTQLPDLKENFAGASKFWGMLLTKYTGRGITFDSDRLPAFSGIAPYFAPCFPGRYLAGIWEAHMPYGLCWRRKMPVNTPARHTASPKWTAPTWSWASMPATVSLDCPQLSGFKELVEPFRPTILEISCDVSEEAPYGRVDNGYIRMEAPLFEVQITCYKTKAVEPHNLLFRLSFGPEIGEIKTSRLKFVEDCLLAVEEGNAVRATQDYQVNYRQDPSSFEGTAWVLWLDGNKEKQMSGIVLGLDKASKGYQRIGFDVDHFAF
ncbi:HET-domain-containing [Fusarium albosuccineum]|uniref:HET-domain-containing n=1 Tax=Fusarium albosuccineum TaxID=1237068 RepID=A0A8H4P2W2_9HYPO|nr:HET-domain-containing [Fusarium albosuccineum]